MPFHTHTLPNGLTIIGEPSPAARSAAVGFFVRTGSRDERAQTVGQAGGLRGDTPQIHPGREVRPERIGALQWLHQLPQMGSAHAHKGTEKALNL